jgi:hypothetical protein
MPNTTARLHHWARLRQGDKIARVTRIRPTDAVPYDRYVVERPDATFHVARTWRDALAVAAESLVTACAVASLTTWE